MRVYLDVAPSPAGPLAFAVDDEGTLIAAQFLDGRPGRTIERDLAAEGYDVAEDPARTATARGELAEYAAGARQIFTLPLRFAGTAWQNAVWRALTTIPFGQTRSYGQVAAQVGAPNASRAVGLANGRNRVPLIIPCHRVIGADGSLTGFAGGVHLKSKLLEHEARLCGAARLIEV